MDDMSRRTLMAAAALGGVAATGRAATAATIAPYKRAVVEFASESNGKPGGTIALRVDQQVAHFVDFKGDTKGLIICVVAGLNGWKVDFTTTGEAGGFWQNVAVTAVHKS